jgi:hypothetical protein
MKNILLFYFFCIHSLINGLLITNMSYVEHDNIQDRCQVDYSHKYTTTSYEITRFYGSSPVNTAGIRLPTDAAYFEDPANLSLEK